MKKNFTFVFIFSALLWIFGQGNSKISIHKGNQSFENQDFDEASLYYLQSIQHNEKDFKAHYNLGNTLYKKKNYADAIAEYEKALKYTENNQEKQNTLYNLGNAYLQNNNLQKAIEYYKQALKISPNNELVLNNLRIALKKQNENQPQQNNKEKQNNNHNNPENQEHKKPIDQYAPKDEQKKDTESQELKEKIKKERQEKEEKLLKQIEEREKNTAKRALNPKGYVSRRSNEKDW